MSDRQTVALYPGTFDPVTNGHVDIMARACDLFDRVIVAVANSSKKKPLFDLATRVELMQGACKDLPRIDIQPFEGLLAKEYDRLGPEIGHLEPGLCIRGVPQSEVPLPRTQVGLTPRSGDGSFHWR